MPGHSTSHWRPTNVNSHTRVSCIRPMHQFHRAPATRNVEGFNFKTNASIPPRRQPPRTLAPRPNAFMVDDVVCFSMGMANTLPGHCVLPRRGAPHERLYRLVSTRQAPSWRVTMGRNTRAHNMKNRFSKHVNLIFGLGQFGSTIWARLGCPLLGGPE